MKYAGSLNGDEISTIDEISNCSPGKTSNDYSAGNGSPGKNKTCLRPVSRAVPQGLNLVKMVNGLG